ncbi:MAG: site-specific integrase [Planctomycetota bacterium]
MARKRNELPLLRRHKAKNRAYFQFRGKRYYCGPWGSREAEATYRRMLAEIVLPAMERGEEPLPEAPRVPTSDLLVEDLAADYMEHVRKRYSAKSSQPQSIRLAVRALLSLYGPTHVVGFTPRALVALQVEMARSGLGVRTVNSRITMLVRMFRWGVSEELIPGSIWHALQAVEPLKPGQYGVKPPRKVKAATLEQVQAVIPHLPSRVLRTMVAVHWMTGMRSSELLSMRRGDIDFDHEVWIYTPSEHKTENHGLDRQIGLIPEVQRLLKPFLLRPDDSYLFDPRESDSEHRSQKRVLRKTKVQPSQQRRHECAMREGKSKIGERYTARTYGQAIQRACGKAGLTKSGKRFSPHQLRHAAATAMAKQENLLGAQKALGHASSKTTERYLHLDASVATSAFQAMVGDAVVLTRALADAQAASALAESQDSLPNVEKEAAERGDSAAG